jgi:hypothetical protein
MYVRIYVCICKRMYVSDVCTCVSVCLSVSLSVCLCERVYLVPRAVIERVHVDDAGMPLAVPREQAQLQLLTHVPHRTWLSAWPRLLPAHPHTQNFQACRVFKNEQPQLICSALCSCRRHCRLLSSDSLKKNSITIVLFHINFTKNEVLRPPAHRQQMFANARRTMCSTICFPATRQAAPPFCVFLPSTAQS